MIDFAEPGTSGFFIRLTDGGSLIQELPALPDGPDQYQQLHDAVGGWLQMFLMVPSPIRPSVQIAFYCDEEGLMKDLRPNVMVNGHYIVGPLVIAAARGDITIGLTREEITWVKLQMLFG